MLTQNWRSSLELNACCLAFVLLIIVNAGGETCEDPWKDHGGACFLFALKSKNFFQARDDCYSSGGILASIRNATELHFIVKTIQKLGSAYQRVRWFTGLYQFDDNAANNYRWMDGSLASFRYWMRSQPNNPYERCVQLDGSAGFKWRDDICNQPALYICRREKGAVNCYDKPHTSYVWKALDMSVTLCIEHCRGRGYQSAAVKPDRCFCQTKKDAEKSTIIDLEKCDSLCEEQHCGRDEALAVYNISLYPDIARSCEELTTYGIYHPATYILAKNGENPKKFSCFGHLASMMMMKSFNLEVNLVPGVKPVPQYLKKLTLTDVVVCSNLHSF
ncbi:uncharacterized protein [Centruroides vittatus]|uniref:uncharacterized protein isoform X2 n=1 Tax=Centruroides vittatus TaxID=120091 RepID=UPI00350FF50B